MTTTSILLGSGGSAYTILKSLRFRASASAYLNRTPASAGSQTTWTWSAWVKRGSLGGTMSLFHAGASTANECMVMLDSDSLRLYNDTSSTTNMNLVSTAVYRDPSAWYHFLVVYNSTQATSTNRVSMYVNGVQITSFSTSTYPAQNQTSYINSNIAHQLGERQPSADLIFDGYLAEVNFIDGQALTASSFGTYDTNGVWQPIKYSGTYGTNGFYLPFTNTTSTATLGNDFSGNSNTWTVNNISLTAGSTYDSMTDSPTVTSATVANYAVLNPILQNSWWAAVSRGTIQDGNLTAVSGASVEAFGNFNFVRNSGKWYYEVNCGATDTSNAILLAAQARATFEVSYYQGGNKQVNGGTPAAYGATWTSGDVIGVSIDVPNNNITFYKNNVSQGVINNAFPTSQPVYCGSFFNSSSGSHFYNFGQRPFAYTPPTGFNALNTYNLPTPTIANGAQYMAATTYTGTGATQTISDGGNNTIGTTFQPDLVWIKSRSAATNNNLFDVLRGTTAYLSSNSTSAEATNANTLTAFGSTGFTVGSDASSIGVNVNAATYVGWQWKANGAGVTNTNGSITSTVSANTIAGFSVVTYTGTGVAGATVGHGLGVAPNMIIIKNRGNIGTAEWLVGHSSIGWGSFLTLSTTTAATVASNRWNNTAPTSSVFTVGSIPNSNTETYVAYCWAAVSGYSAFGSYTGNGSTDGPFVYTGFRPRYVFVKETVTVSNWNQWDSSRNPANVTNLLLRPNLSAVENTAGGSDIQVDFLANGFKIRGSSGDFNTNGELIIYAAFAENPFNTARAR